MATDEQVGVVVDVVTGEQRGIVTAPGRETTAGCGRPGCVGDHRPPFCVPGRETNERTKESN